MTRRAPLVGGALAIALALGGGWLGSTVAEPQPSVRPARVEAQVSPPLTVGLLASDLPPAGAVATREVTVGMTAEAITTNVLAYLEAITAWSDPVEAAERLAPAFGMAGAPDSCASGGDCPSGVAGAVGAADAPSVPSSTSGRTTFFAPTPDLIVVTVAHDIGDTVRVFPNVLNGFETECDPVIAGYDLLVKPLGSVTVPYGGGQRTSFAFDIGEGITSILCAEVEPAGTNAVAYSAQAIVRTADRLVPTLSVRSVDGQALPGWTIRGYLPNGQRCGRFEVPGTGVPGTITDAYGTSHLLCDTSDLSGRTTSSPGRGVLRLSSGDHATLTVELAYAQLPADRTSLSLGMTAMCTGACLVPADSFYAVRGRHGAAVLRLTWSQGNSNGSVRTSIGTATDNDTLPPPGAQLDVATSGVRQSGFDVEARSAAASLGLRADGDASYVARLVPVASDPCLRDGAVLEATGTLDREAGETWTAADTVSFTGLCAGADYSVVIELTDPDGVVTVWDENTWGAPARLHVREMAVPLSIVYRINSDAYFSDANPYFAALTVRAGDQFLIGPHDGGCFGVSPGIDGAEALPVLRLGEHVHLSGSVQTATIDPDSGCLADWATSLLALTFATDFTLEDLYSAPEGVVIRVDQSYDADPSVRAQASAIIHIALDR